MDFPDVMRELESMGTEQNRKVFRRHGVTGDQFGVSMANLDKLAKRIKRDHALARRLWDTGNHDAHLLATRIADPALLDEPTIDAWARALDNYAGRTACAMP